MVAIAAATIAVAASAAAAAEAAAAAIVAHAVVHDVSLVVAVVVVTGPCPQSAVRLTCLNHLELLEPTNILTPEELIVCPPKN